MADAIRSCKIPSAKVAELKAAFLSIFPKPDDFAGTDKQWIEQWMRRQLQNVYRQAKHAELISQLPNADTVITEG